MGVFAFALFPWMAHCCPVGISRRQFEQMKDRVAGKARREFVPFTPCLPATMARL